MRFPFVIQLKNMSLLLTGGKHVGCVRKTGASRGTKSDGPRVAYHWCSIADIEEQQTKYSPVLWMEERSVFVVGGSIDYENSHRLKPISANVSLRVGPAQSHDIHCHVPRYKAMKHSCTRWVFSEAKFIVHIVLKHTHAHLVFQDKRYSPCPRNFLSLRPEGVALVPFILQQHDEVWWWLRPVEMWWHTRRNQISSFGETDESIKIGGGVSSVDYWQSRGAHQRY